MIWKNPIFIRFCRSELRLKKAVFWYLLTLIASAFTVSLPVLVQDSAYEGARVALPILLTIQGIILLFLGTGKMAIGITREKVDNVLNYQRLTPLPVRSKIQGYLFGLPVKFYVMFLITMPFMVFVLIAGKIPATVFLPYYLIFFTSTLLYHFTGMAAGMVTRHWWLSALISMGLIFMLYLVLPLLSHIGLVFLEFLTVRPAFAEYIMPIVTPSQDVFGLLAGNKVPFYTISISGTIFSFILQSGLIVLFATIISRKWKADTIPAVSKPMAIAVIGAFAFMSLANLWSNLTRAENALHLFDSSGEIEAAIVVIAFPLILALSTIFLTYSLMLSALPSPMQFRHGRIRAMRLLKSRLSLWADPESGHLFTAAVFLVLSTLFFVMYFTMNRTGFFSETETSPWGVLWLIIAIGLSLFYFQGLKENFGVGPIALFVLIGWMLPILVAILVVAGNQNLLDLAMMISGLSPLTIIPYAVLQGIPAEVAGDDLPAFQEALGVAILTLVIMNAWLHARLRIKRKQMINPKLGVSSDS